MERIIGLWCEGFKASLALLMSWKPEPYPPPPKKNTAFVITVIIIIIIIIIIIELQKTAILGTAHYFGKY